TFTWADGDDKTAVWGIPVDGGAQRKLAAVEGAAVRSYAWSPDGSTIWMLAGAEEEKARTKQAKAGFNSVVYEEEAKLTRLFSARVGTEVDAEPKAVSIPGYVSAFRVAPDGRHAV
ncbi:MAG TPA: S9 family peptidase, partial [Erythrobacter sp.]|nr:S9 family peptidase [Erythrobacter sp.]